MENTISEIKEFGKYIDEYHKTLADKSINFLFISTLACWGVSNTIFQNIAFIIVFIYLLFGLNDVLGEGTFEKKYFETQIKIMQNYDTDKIQKFFDELLAFKNRKLGISMMLNNKDFFIWAIAFIFWFSSFFYFLYK